MPLTNEGKAPYAPAEPLTELVEKYRDHGLATPFTADVLARAGVTDSLVPRVMAAMKLLDLTDSAGNPSPQLELLRKAPSPEYKERVAEWVRGVYAPIFQFVDPATATADAIEDAFRVYEPAGQRGRMVTLFSALCEYAGIVTQAPTKKRGPAKVSDKTATKANPSNNATKRDPKPKPPETPNVPPAGASYSQVIELRSGGLVTLTVGGNPLSFTAEDREFVFTLVDTMNNHRERRNGSQAEQGNSS